MKHLPSPRAGLLAHRLDDQFLVYDPSADKIHLLDPTTARVYDLLDSRHSTRGDILRELASLAGGQADEALLALALDELSRAGLLESPSGVERSIPDVTRRQLLRGLATAGATALLIPAITTLTASNLNAQGTCIPIGSACTTDAQCCIGSNGGRHCHHIGTDPPGSFCHDT